jgi:hypothetical protein
VQALYRLQHLFLKAGHGLQRPRNIPLPRLSRKLIAEIPEDGDPLHAKNSASLGHPMPELTAANSKSALTVTIKAGPGQPAGIPSSIDSHNSKGDGARAGDDRANKEGVLSSSTSATASRKALEKPRRVVVIDRNPVEKMLPPGGGEATADMPPAMDTHPSLAAKADSRRSAMHWNSIWAEQHRQYKEQQEQKQQASDTSGADGDEEEQQKRQQGLEAEGAGGGKQQGWQGFATRPRPRPRPGQDAGNLNVDEDTEIGRGPQWQFDMDDNEVPQSHFSPQEPSDGKAEGKLSMHMKHSVLFMNKDGGFLEDAQVDQEDTDERTKKWRKLQNVQTDRNGVSGPKQPTRSGGYDDNRNGRESASTHPDAARMRAQLEALQRAGSESKSDQVSEGGGVEFRSRTREETAMAQMRAQQAALLQGRLTLQAELDAQRGRETGKRLEDMGGVLGGYVPGRPEAGAVYPGDLPAQQARFQGRG